MEKKDLNKKISECISDNINYNGVSLEFSKHLIDIINSYGFIHNIDDYIQADDLHTYINGTYLDNHTLLSVLQNMLMNGEAEVIFTDKATDKNVNYIKKLAQCNFDTSTTSTNINEDLCFEEQEDLEIFKTMLNKGIQRLSLSKEDVIQLLNTIYQ